MELPWCALPVPVSPQALVLLAQKTPVRAGNRPGRPARPRMGALGSKAPRAESHEPSHEWVGLHTGGDGRPGGRADRRGGVEGGEAEASRGQPVDGRGDGGRVAVAAEVAVPAG